MVGKNDTNKQKLYTVEEEIRNYDSWWELKHTGFSEAEAKKLAQEIANETMGLSARILVWVSGEVTDTITVNYQLEHERVALATSSIFTSKISKN